MVSFKMRKQKEIFKKLLAATALILLILPVLVIFSQGLTDLFDRFALYTWLQRVVVPFEAKLVVSLLSRLGIEGLVTPGSEFAMLLKLPGGAILPVKLEWNCLGWQSFLLFGLTILTGLRGGYTIFSKFLCVVFGVLGIFWTNILRITGFTALMYYRNDIAAMILHDYVAVLVALLWLFFFWYFSYSFVLEERRLKSDVDSPKRSYSQPSG